MKKPLVVYLSVTFLDKEHLINFQKFYKKFESGYSHDLLICFKNENKLKNKEFKKLVDLKYIYFEDNHSVNDYDIGSFYRIAKKFPDRNILFLGTYTYPINHNWLKIFVDNYKERCVLGASGSYASISSQHLSFYHKKHTKFQQLRWGLKHFTNVKLFPNPHIRTTGFYVKSSDFIKLKFNLNNLKKKIYTNYFESGREGMSSQFLKKGYKLYIVNSDGIKFDIKDWPKSETFCIGDQKKTIFSDKLSREYHQMNWVDKKKTSYNCWGKK